MKERVFPKQDQFAQELIEFSECVLSAKDHPRIIEALLRSAQTGQPVKLDLPAKKIAEKPEVATLIASAGDPSIMIIEHALDSSSPLCAATIDTFV